MTRITETVTLLAMIFLASSLVILVMDRFSHPVLPGYILAGLAVGMFIDSQHQIIQLSQLGIAFLVFIFGLKTEPGRIKSVARESLSTTLLQVVFLAMLAYVFAAGIGLDLVNTLYLMAAASLSSSLVGLQLVEDEIRVDLIHGRLAESIHLVQDLVAIVLVLAAAASPFTFPSIANNLLHGSLLILLALAVRSTVFPYIAEQVEKSLELTMFTGIVLLAGFMGLTTFLDVSIVVGSFAAGLAAAKFPYNLELLDSMGSLKDFFSAIFFVSLGALVTFPRAETLVITAFLLFSTVVLKPAITVIGLLINGYDRRTSYLTALTLDQVSEFALIIAIQAFVAGNIAPELFNAVIITAIATMVTSAYTDRHDEKLYRKISSYSSIETSSRKLDRWSSVGELRDHVILVGYDTQAKMLAETMTAEGQEFVVVENDPEKVLEAREREENYVFGDIMDDRTWQRARAGKAKLLVSTVPFMNVSLEILDHQKPEEKILRARNVQEAHQLLHRGATYVEVPDIVAAEELIDHLRGVMENENYREELRRKNLLELRNQLQQDD